MIFSTETKKAALNDLEGVILSDKTAFSLFNTTKGLIGKTVEWRSEEKISGLYKITGVVKSPPSNTSDSLMCCSHFSTTLIPIAINMVEQVV
jgi:hypothetical protein